VASKLNGSVRCEDDAACPYRHGYCGQVANHVAHDWRPRMTMMSAPQAMFHCGGEQPPEPSGFDGQED